MNNDLKLSNILDKYRENKNSHVYLVETNSIDDAIADIKKIIIEINNFNSNNVEDLVNNNSLPTLNVLTAEKMEIKTEQVEHLIQNLQKIPVITKENYFIVSECEKLNKKSGNQMLKIIEEPETDVIGFFICNSVDGVMPTIQSRAQYISLKYDQEKKYDECLKNDAENYFNNIHSNNVSILQNKYIVDNYKDINKLIEFVECLSSIEKKYIESISDFDIMKRESYILKKLYNLISNIKKNGNVNLLLDEFIIEVSRL